MFLIGWRGWNPKQNFLSCRYRIPAAFQHKYQPSNILYRKQVSIFTALIVLYFDAGFRVDCKMVVFILFLRQRSLSSGSQEYSRDLFNKICMQPLTIFHPPNGALTQCNIVLSCEISHIVFFKIYLRFYIIVHNLKVELFVNILHHVRINKVIFFPHITMM